MNIDLLFLTCSARIVTPLVEDMTTYLEAAPTRTAQVVKYGMLCKGYDGFIIVAALSSDGFSSGFLETIQQNDEITGYVLLSNGTMPPTEMEVQGC